MGSDAPSKYPPVHLWRWRIIFSYFLIFCQSFGRLGFETSRVNYQVLHIYFFSDAFPHFIKKSLSVRPPVLAWKTLPKMSKIVGNDWKTVQIGLKWLKPVSILRLLQKSSKNPNSYKSFQKLSVLNSKASLYERTRSVSKRDKLADVVLSLHIW